MESSENKNESVDDEFVEPVQPPPNIALLIEAAAETPSRAYKRLVELLTESEANKYFSPVDDTLEDVFPPAKKANAPLLAAPN